MNRLWVRAAICLVLATVGIASQVITLGRAHAPGVSLSAFTPAPPVIDGTIGPVEWAFADRSDFAFRRSSVDGAFYVMNDASNLYVAVRVFETSWRFLVLSFDDNHNGIVDSYEDELVYPPLLGCFDSYTSYSARPGFFILHGCDWSEDGSVGFASDGTSSFYEFSHPLCSGDTLHDFCLSTSDTIGFNLGWGDSWPGELVQDPSMYAQALNYGDITIAPPGPTVQIDIKPGTRTNRINLRSEGLLPVAILTTPEFDTSTVDIAAVKFGRTGTEAASLHSTFEDPDGDGDLDLVLQFRVRDTGIMAGDTQAVLSGRTIDGTRFAAVDSIFAFSPGDVTGNLGASWMLLCTFSQSQPGSLIQN